MTGEIYDLITAYLTRFYDNRLYQQHGLAHPVLHHAPAPHQINDIDSVLGHLTPEIPERDDLAFYNYAYLHSLQNSARHLFNGTTYALKRLRTNPLRIDATLGSYYDMIATCIALEVELLDVMAKGMVRLPMRTQYHRTHDARTSLQSGKGRSAAIGGVMLTVFNDEGRYRAIVSQRTGQHATRPNALHLLPAFIFQPMTADRANAEWSLTYHLYREYLEELIGMPEGEASFGAHPALLDLQAMEADGRASIQLTGISMNLLTLRAEISTVLVIHDPEWWPALQDGTRGYHLDTPESHADLLLIPIDSDDSIMKHLPDDYHLSMVPQAIPAFWEGIAAARDLIIGYRET